MTKYYVIGNMTGNSMDAIDLVLTEFDGDKMKDICSFSMPYSKNMQKKIEYLRGNVRKKTRKEIMKIPEFKEIHDEYIRQVADCINQMCKKFKIKKNKVSAIGFHGKTLDHNPPSKDKKAPYTLQIGSGQMLADLTGIPVVYDFRSAFIKAGLDGAPLVSLHNAHIAAIEGNACFYNGGNTSNFAWIIDKKATVVSDAGPFNEYVDNFIRKNNKGSFDKDGKFGLKGKLNKKLLQKLFDIGRKFYEKKLPKSGDPQYYHKDKVFDLIAEGKISFNDAVHTLEYFAAYIAVQALTLTKKNVKLPAQILLFGGGWKNPVARQSFDNLIAGKGYVLPEHKAQFKEFLNKFTTTPIVKYSDFGESMEARLFADLARYKLQKKAWITPDSVSADKKIISGRIANPNEKRKNYTDYINKTCYGWQNEILKRNKK